MVIWAASPLNLSPSEVVEEQNFPILVPLIASVIPYLLTFFFVHFWSQVSAIAEELLKTEYDAVRIIFNRFQSAISFKPTIATVLSPDALEKEVESAGKLDTYEVEGPDRGELLQDLAEFHLAAVRCSCSPIT